MTDGLSEGDLEVSVLTEGDTAIVECRGEIDLATAPILSAALRSLTSADVVVDFAEVALIDSSGAYAVMNGLRRATRAGRGFALCCVRPELQRALELMGLRRSLPVCGTRGEARDAARAAGLRQRVRAGHLSSFSRG